MDQAIKVFGIDVATAANVGAVVAIADGAMVASTEVLARVLGTAPTFEHWEKTRIEWRSGYAEQKGEGVTANTIDKAWSRQAAAMAEAHGLTKPASASPEAVKKADARKAADPVKGKTLDEVRTIKAKAAEDIKTAPSPETVRLYAQALEAEHKLLKAEGEARAKAAKLSLQPRIDAMVKLVRNADARTLTLFEALIDATTAEKPTEQREAAWGVIMACAPGAAKADKAAKAATDKAAKAA